MMEVKYFDNGYVIVDGQNVICGGTDKSEAHFVLNKLMAENASRSELDSNIIKSIQRGTTTVAKVAISSVNPDKCVVLLDNSDLSNTSNRVDGAFVTQLTSNQLLLSLNYCNGDQTTGWQIIEFR